MSLEPVPFLVQTKALLIILHVLTVVVGMGAAFITDILTIRFALDKKLARFEVQTIRFLSHVVVYALSLVILSGVLIFFTDPNVYLVSAKFLLKMTVVVFLCVNGFLLHKFVFAHIDRRNVITSRNASGVRKLAFSLGAISVTSWTLALVLGIIDTLTLSYATGLALYTLLLLTAVLVALCVESFVQRRLRK